MAEKLSLAFLNTMRLAQDERMNAMQSEIDELKSRLTALSNTRTTRQNPNVGRPITANQAKALGEFGIDTTGWDFMQASRQLDELSKLVRDLGIRHYQCGNRDHKHTDKDEARRCAMGQSAHAATHELDLPSY